MGSIELTKQENQDFPQPSTYNPFANIEKIQTILNSINEPLLRSYLETLVDLAPRYTGTAGCERAASSIHDQFSCMGLETRYDDWSALDDRYHPGEYISQTVEATLPGLTDDIILFSAHYDTVENVPGG